jgi:hypothetical protein
MAAGLNPTRAFEDALTLASSPDPRNDRFCITSLCPRQFLVTSACRQLRRRQQVRLLEPLAAHHHGPGHAREFVGAATLIGRRSIRRVSQSRFVPCWRAYRMTAIAPATRSQLKCRFPCFEILPSRSLPPGRMLSRHQADPCSETTARREHLPISTWPCALGSHSKASSLTNQKLPAAVV